MKTAQQSFPELGAALGISELWLKREDTHPYGSHKGRSIPLMIKEYAKYNNCKNFVISSSGNAALAAAITIQKYKTNKPEDPLTLRIFVGKNIEPHKKRKLEALTDGQIITLEEQENPKQAAFQLDQAGMAKNLRQSTDDLALRGYLELADEINKIQNLQAIFVPTSSGTTAQGLSEAFQRLSQKPQIHIVQTTSCHPLVDAIHQTTPTTKATEKSLATAIVDHIGARQKSLTEAIQKTHGNGWIVDNAEIAEAMRLALSLSDTMISPNSALSLAGIKKATDNGWQSDGAVVAIITGE